MIGKIFSSFETGPRLKKFVKPFWSCKTGLGILFEFQYRKWQFKAKNWLKLKFKARKAKETIQRPKNWLQKCFKASERVLGPNNFIKSVYLECVLEATQPFLKLQSYFLSNLWLYMDFVAAFDAWQGILKIFSYSWSLKCKL